MTSESALKLIRDLIDDYDKPDDEGKPTVELTREQLQELVSEIYEIADRQL